MCDLPLADFLLRLKLEKNCRTLSMNSARDVPRHAPKALPYRNMPKMCSNRLTFTDDTVNVRNTSKITVSLFDSMLKNEQQDYCVKARFLDVRIISCSPKKRWIWTQTTQFFYEDRAESKKRTLVPRKNEFECLRQPKKLGRHFWCNVPQFFHQSTL